MKPRNLAGPVVRGPDFWGRETEVEDLWHLLDRGHVLLNGPRRYGKSSLMYALFDNPKEAWRPIYIDLESLETAADFVTTLGAELLCQTKLSEVIRRAKNLPGALRGWLASWIQEVTFQSPDVGEVKLQLRRGTAEAAQLSVLADQLLAQLRVLPNKTAILFDEFPMMVAAMLDRDQEEGLRFLKWFRASRQNPGMESVSFLVGGSLNIEPRLERLGSESLLGDLQRFRLSPMSHSQSLLFIEEVFDAEERPVEAGVSQEILRIARTGVHYYLQVIIQECLSRARQERRKLLISDVSAVYSEKVVGPEGRHRFSHYHTRLRSYGSNEYVARIVLDYLCRNASSSVEELAHLVAEFGADSAVVDNVLVRLEGDYYVVKEGARYRFSDGLIRDWWIRNSVSPSRS